MEPYNFWQDLLDTYQSLSDGLKLAWLIVPPAFILGLTGLFRFAPRTSRKGAQGKHGKLVYSVYASDDNRLFIHAHGMDAPATPTHLPVSHTLDRAGDIKAIGSGAEKRLDLSNE